MSEIIVPVIMLALLVGVPVAILAIRDLANRSALRTKEANYAALRESDEQISSDWEFRFQFQPTANEEIQRLRWENRDSVGHPIIRVPLVVLMVWVLVGSMHRMFITGVIWTTAASSSERIGLPIVALMSIGGLWLLVVEPTIRRRRVLGATTLSVRNIAFTKEGLFFDDQAEPTEWPKIRRWFERKGGILFELVDNTRLFLPESAFRSKNQRSDFLGQLMRIHNREQVGGGNRGGG